MVVEDIGNQHENVESAFRIKEELLEDKKEMLKNMSEIQKLDRTRFPCIKKVENGVLLIEVKKVSELLKKIKSKNVIEDNDLFYLDAAWVTKVFA